MKSTAFQWLLLFGSTLLFLLLFKTTSSMFLLLVTIWGISVLLGKWVDIHQHAPLIPAGSLALITLITQWMQNSVYLAILSQQEKTAYLQSIVLISAMYVVVSYAGIWIGRMQKNK
jgi:hypothetical protein